VLQIYASYLLAGEQQPSSKAINYKLVPNLQEIKGPSSGPDFTLPDLETGKVSLRDFRGKLLLLNFWASWCAPCREEMPAMERLYQRYKDQGFVILGVNVKDDKKSALSFAKELKITFPIAFDPKGEVGILYGAWGLPTTYLILSIPRESLWREPGDLPTDIVPALGSLLRKYWTNRNDQSIVIDLIEWSRQRDMGCVKLGCL
jgi:peroxiredoxin